jgi:hypothetical protein
MFTPFNFHDRDPSRKSAQGVKVEKGAGATKPQYFGGTYKEDVKLKLVSISIFSCNKWVCVVNLTYSRLI